MTEILGGEAPPCICQSLSARNGSITQKLGPLPGEALSAMRGYGMDDSEIAAYFGVTLSTLQRLRRTLPVTQPWRG